jgi:hypothetical protein
MKRQHQTSALHSRQILLSLFSVMLLLLPLTISSAFAQGAEAGKLLLSLGDVQLNRNGKFSPLKKGDAIQAGDTIVTGPTSNAQVRMTDGAVIAIRSQTEFKINEYQFNGKADGSEKASLSLVKGGVRAVTGVIGRENRDNLKVDAVVATIGIRGTGFNIVYCQSNCAGADKALAKNGLYAGVFEGRVTVANQANSGVFGVNEPIFVESTTSSITKLKEAPSFLKDILAAQVIVPKKADSVVNPIMAPVSTPQDSADSTAPASSAIVGIDGIYIIPAPQITRELPTSITTGNYYNKPGMGTGSVVAARNFGAYFLQLAEVFPGSTGPDGLPIHNVTPINNQTVSGDYAGYWGAEVNGTSTASNPTKLTLYTSTSLPTSIATVDRINSLDQVVPPSTSDIYQLNAIAATTGSQVEGGTYNGIVSWGRWAGTVEKVGGYNLGNPITYETGSGFSYVVGTLTPASYLSTQITTLNFTLLGATSPSLVSNPSGSWYVTSGNMTANFAAAAISGNLAMTTIQPTGYGNYNMGFSGALGTTASNDVTTALTRLSGTLNTCAATCTGSGNVSFYGPTANAAGLAYDVNTGTNVLQGVAVFKKN